MADAKVTAMAASGDADDKDSDDKELSVTSLRGRVAELEAEVSECKKKTEQREEEVKLYKTKYEEASKQATELVSSCSPYQE